VGPDLAHVGEFWTRADLENWLTDPSAHDAVAQMPTLVLTPEEIAALATYLLSLESSEGEPTPSDLTRP
jgi:mono/diheme cytochrome c family protein